MLADPIVTRVAPRAARRSRRVAAVAATAVFALASASPSAFGIAFPVSETFTSNPSDWGSGQTSTFTAPGWTTADGVTANDGHLSVDRVHTSGSTVAIFRNSQNFPSPNTGSSGGAFIGNWEAANLTEIGFDIKHSNPTPTVFSVRISTDTNNPAFSISDDVAVPAGAWTHVTIPLKLSDYVVDAALPAAQRRWTYEAGPLATRAAEYSSIFGAVFNFQVTAPPTGVSPAPTTTSTTTFNYGLDNVTVVPEPASFGLVAVGGLAALARRRRRAAAVV